LVFLSQESKLISKPGGALKCFGHIVFLFLFLGSECPHLTVP
jgi:hypothetical protein